MLRRLIGVLLVFGGGHGLISVVTALGSQLSIGQVFTNILFFMLYIWSIVTGILVIENQSKGWLWAKILMLIQVPIFQTSMISYKFVVGINWSADFATTHVKFLFSSHGLYRLDFFNSQTTLSLGINLIALSLFLLIWRRT